MVAKQPSLDASIDNLTRLQWRYGVPKDCFCDAEIGLLLTIRVLIGVILRRIRLHSVTAGLWHDGASRGYTVAVWSAVITLSNKAVGSGAVTKGVAFNRIALHCRSHCPSVKAIRAIVKLTGSASSAGVAATAALLVLPTGFGGIGNKLQVLVRDNNVDQALKALKKKMQREGIFREMKLRGHYEKPSEKRVREKAEAVRRQRKLARKKLQREGLLPAPKKKVFEPRPARPVF